MTNCLRELLAFVYGRLADGSKYLGMADAETLTLLIRKAFVSSFLPVHYKQL